MLTLTLCLTLAAPAGFFEADEDPVERLRATADPVSDEPPSVARLRALGVTCAVARDQFDAAQGLLDAATAWAAGHGGTPCPLWRAWQEARVEYWRQAARALSASVSDWQRQRAWARLEDAALVFGPWVPAPCPEAGPAE